MRYLIQLVFFVISAINLCAEDIAPFLAGNVHWLDLPKDSLEKIGGLSCGNSEIDQFIQQYHSVDKTDPSKINTRIIYLDKIANLLSEYEKREVNFNSKKFLKNIHKTAIEKRRYLEALDGIRLMLSLNPEYITNYMRNTSKNCTDSAPLFLVNERKYDSKLRIYWGEYFLEVIDPCHRFLTSYYDLWIESNPINSDYFSFLYWLESQNVHFEVTAVHYFSSSEKSKYEIIVEEGRLKEKCTGKLLNCYKKEEEHLFIIDLEKKLYVTKASKEIRHTSLSYGKPVLAAGNLVVRQGIIYRLGLESGHYQPNTDDGQQLLNILVEQGANFSSDAALDFYYNGEKQSLLLSEFKEKFSSRI